MKKIALTLCFALVLGSNAMAHGHWCGWGFWPRLSIGFGLGAVFGISLRCGPDYWSDSRCPVYTCPYSQPACDYATPVYDPPPPAPAAFTPDKAPSPADWVPSTPGAGHWVPDPAPYRYTPPAAVRRTAGARPVPRQTVTVTRSREGIPIYSISYAE